MNAPEAIPSLWENALRLLEDASDLDSLSRILLRVQRTTLGVRPAAAAVHLEVAPGVHVTHRLTDRFPGSSAGQRLVVPYSRGEVEIYLPPETTAPPRSVERLRRIGPLLGVIHDKLRGCLSGDEARRLTVRPTEADADSRFRRLVGASDPMARVRRRLSAIARRPSDVLLIGESGTGKELAAQALHDAWGRTGRLVAVNCGTLDGDIAQSRLFGHEKGAFTGAERSRPGAFREAQEGTLFLDEVNSLSAAAQAYLLRALETRNVVPVGSDRDHPVDVRVISATNASLRAAAAKGRFRADLLARIETVTVVLPPLRARPEDVPELSARFLLAYSIEHGLPVLTLEPRAAALLSTQPWPGNVRELFAVLTRAALHCDAARPTIGAGDVHAALHPEADTGGGEGGGVAEGPETRADRSAAYEAQMRAFERGLLEAALEATGWNVSAAARRMGMTRSRLRNRIRVLEIPSESSPEEARGGG